MFKSPEERKKEIQKNLSVCLGLVIYVEIVSTSKTIKHTVELLFKIQQKRTGKCTHQ